MIKSGSFAENQPYRVRFVQSLLFILLLAGCAGTRGGDIPYSPPSFGSPDIPVAVNVDHKLAPGDVISISIFQVDNLSGEQTIDSAGRVTLPLVGAIDAGGKTTSELAAILSKRLGERYLKSPQVLVTLKTVVQPTVTVDGSVKQPGIYPIGDRTSLIQAIALARGPDEGANLKRVVIFRQINGQRQAAAFDLSTIRKGKDPDPEIFRDDVIVVDGSGVKSAFRNLIQTVPLLAIFRPF